MLKQATPAINKNIPYGFFRPNFIRIKFVITIEVSSKAALTANVKYGLRPRSLLFKPTP